MTDKRHTWRASISGRVRLAKAQRVHRDEMALADVADEMARPMVGALRGADRDLALAIINEHRTEPETVHGGGVEE